MAMVDAGLKVYLLLPGTAVVMLSCASVTCWFSQRIICSLLVSCSLDSSSRARSRSLSDLTPARSACADEVQRCSVRA